MKYLHLIRLICIFTIGFNSTLAKANNSQEINIIKTLPRDHCMHDLLKLHNEIYEGKYQLFSLTRNMSTSERISFVASISPTFDEARKNPPEAYAPSSSNPPAPPPPPAPCSDIHLALVQQCRDEQEKLKTKNLCSTSNSNLNYK